jgi:hypothetical protein
VVDVSNSTYAELGMEDQEEVVPLVDMATVVDN